MDMKMFRLHLASAPVLALFRDTPEESARLGTILFYHGFGESKDGQALHQRLMPYYAQAPERLRYIEYPNASHDLSAKDWEKAWDMAAKWFTIYLPLKPN